LIPLIVKLIDAYSWRTAFVILGAAIIVLGVPFSLAFRHKPEQYGYLPDGAEIIEKPLSAKSESPTHPGEHTAGSMRQALKKFAFWTLTIGFTLQYLV
jgi:sugar phosphate permease